MNKVEKKWASSGKHNCPSCGKTFYVEIPNEYVYKIKHKWYCSYSCWRKAQTTKPLKGSRKQRTEGI